MCCEMFGISGESPRVLVSVERIFVFYLYLLTMIVGITIMKTNKMEHFVCGVLATYGLVVACGNAEELYVLEDVGKLQRRDRQDDSRCPCVLGQEPNIRGNHTQEGLNIRGDHKKGPKMPNNVMDEEYLIQDVDEDEDEEQ